MNSWLHACQEVDGEGYYFSEKLAMQPKTKQNKTKQNI
jgi:hypothetical protein